MSVLMQLLLYSIQLMLPFMAFLIIYNCFISLFMRLKKHGPLILLLKNPGKEVIPVVNWENSIGRNKRCDIVLSEPTVSRNHAVLFRRDEGWFISDTGSKGGVAVNGKETEGKHPVYIDDTVEIGGVNLTLKKSDFSEVEFRKKNKFLSQGTLLLWVSIFHFFGFLQLCLGSDGFDFKPLLIFASLCAISWISFFVTRGGFRRVSFELEILGIFLSGIGIINACTLGIEDTYTQVISLAVGIVVFNIIILFVKKPEIAMKCRPYIAIAAIILLVVNLIFGKVKNGSQNWIIIGSISIQPSELVKIAFVLFGASTLEELQTTKNLTWFIIFSFLCMGSLFLMGDFGTACIFFVTFVIIAFMRSGSMRTIFLICSGAVIGLGMIFKFKPYIMQRFAAWRHVWEHVNDLGYQQTRVLSYSASGGLFGMGIGKGCLKYVFAGPSDLVFGMICEEWGLIMVLLAVFSIAFICLYARKASTVSRSAFYSIASCSAAGLLMFQMMMNIFGVIDIFPLTGVTLPFMSLGGSSMICVWGLLAFIKASDERTYAVYR